jgi:hypothetical protein
MSSTLRFAERPDRAVFSSSVGPTVITNAAMTNGPDYVLTAGTYTFTVVQDGVTRWTQTSVVIADLHTYAIPNISSNDSGATAGVVTLVV